MSARCHKPTSVQLYSRFVGACEGCRLWVTPKLLGRFEIDDNNKFGRLFSQAIKGSAEYEVQSVLQSNTNASGSQGRKRRLQ
jgi:hypothetical protein